MIKNLNMKGKLLSAICAGPRFLAKAGILDEVKYTTSIQEWTEDHINRYKESDPFPRNNFINQRVVRDKNIITAKGIAFIDFSIEICDYFNLFKDKRDKEEFIKNIKGL